MKKYWLVFKTAAQDQIAERANIFFWFLLLLIPFASLIFLWITVYSQGQTVGAFQLNELITYYFGAAVLDWINIWVHWGIDYDIRYGDLNSYLIRPVNYFLFRFFKAAGKDTTHSIIGFPLFAAIAFVIKRYLVVSFSIDWAFLLVAAVILNILLHYTFSFCLGMITFWTTEGTGFFYFVHTLVSFLGGASLPLDAFPNAFKSVLKFLPFRFFYSFPMELYLGRLNTNEALCGFATQILWIVFFYFLYRMLWSRGLKRYYAFGG